MWSADELRAASLAELERVFVSEPTYPGVMSGRVRGSFLAYVDSEGARRLAVRAMDDVLLRALAWGIDWDERRWLFPQLGLRAGHFRVERGPSRWRSTEVLRLRYDVSRLPFRAILYDEVKPLSADLALGLGGLEGPRGEGDHFFFALTR